MYADSWPDNDDGPLTATSFPWPQHMYEFPDVPDKCMLGELCNVVRSLSLTSGRLPSGQSVEFGAGCVNMMLPIVWAGGSIRTRTHQVRKWATL